MRSIRVPGAVSLIALLVGPALARAGEAQPDSPVAAAPTPPAPADPIPTADPAATSPTVAVAEPIAEPATTDAAPPVADVGVTRTPAWYDDLALNGFASVAYSFNTNRPMDDSNQLRVFDTQDNTLAVDVIELVLQKPVENPGDAGFRFDITAGSSIPRVAASAGLFRDASGNAQDVDLQQALVSWIAPAGAGLRIDAGKFVTHVGYELIEGYDGYNDSYTRSILFGYAIPFTHTGIKASYPISSKLSGMVMLANGWDNVRDNNAGKTFGAQLAATPVDGLAAYLNYVGGPEKDGNSSDWRHVIDLVATYQATPVVSVGVNGDLGAESGSAADGGTAMWYGAAVYGKLDATARLALALRGELFDDRDGVRTGAAQKVVEGTFSPTVKMTDHVLFRGDLRLDRSDAEVFMTDSGTAKTQLTLALNALGVF